MEINWTVEYDLNVTDYELDEMVNTARVCMERGTSQEEAVSLAVQGYLEGQDDAIFYTITEEATEQIEAEVNKLLTEQGLDKPHSIWYNRYIERS